MLKKIFNVLMLMIFLQILYPGKFYAQTSSPDFVWAASAGGFAYDNSRDVITDRTGNIFITGSYDVSADFGDTTLVTETANAFIAKLDGQGNFLWAKSVLNFGTIEVVTITLDNSENIIIAGNFSGRFQLETFEELNSFGGYDVFIIKYSPEGDLIWLEQFGDADDNLINDISTDAFNDIYFTGFKFFLSNFQNQIYIASFDMDGNLKWQRSASGSGIFDRGTGICVTALNSVFATGSFGDTKIFQGSNSLTQDSIVISNGATDIFLAKYDLSGNLIRVQNVNKPNYDEGGKIIEDNNGDIVVTGITGAVSGADVYLAKYSDTGNLIWETLHSFLPYNVYPKINLDNAGNISLIFLSTLGENNNRGQGEIYFSRFNNLGVNLWTTNYGSFDFDDPGDIDIDINGDIILSGGFTADGFFGDTTLISVQASKDVFVTKVSAPKINFNPTAVDFGNLIIGESFQRQVLVENVTGSTLYFFNVTLIEENQELNFQILSGLPVDSLLPFQSINVNIQFAPQNPGLKTGFLILETDAPTSPDTLFLTGTGILPALSFSADTLDFGIVDVTNFSDLILTITNDNPFEIIIDSASVSGGDQNNFSLVNPPQFPAALPAGGFLNLSTRFSPLTSGLKSSSLVIISNSSGSPDLITLTGDGIESIIITLPDSAVIGQSTTVTANSPGPTFTSNQFFYRRTGEIVYQQAQLFPSGNIYIGNIPSLYSTIRGIQFYIVFTDVSQGSVITYPTNNPVNNPASIQVNIPVLNFPSTVMSNKYQMISVPLVLADPDLSSVLEDDYGTYDNKLWRFFRWDPSAGIYTEFEDISDNFQPGNSFWLINRNGQSFDIENTLTVPSNNFYTITVQPGWNQIANPFAFPVAWGDVENSDLLMQAPARWNPDTEEYEYDQLVLNPWEGYWVYDSLQQIINLNVPPVESPQGLEKNIYKNFSSNSFIVQIKSKLELTDIKDNQNYVGMDVNALDSFDKFDIIEAPPVTDNLRLSIVSGGKNYVRNIVSISSEGAYWDLSVSTGSQNRNVNLLFEEKIPLPENFKMWLIDIEEKRSLPIINNSSLINMGNQKEKKTRLIIGSEEYAKSVSENISLLPDEYKLFQNFPNPFNPETNIYFTLKEKSSVTFEIFDILGRKIKSLIKEEEMDAGLMKTVWDATDSNGKKVSSGIYIYRIKANEYISSMKMLLLK
jgi:hypothetical protein